MTHPDDRKRRKKPRIKLADRELQHLGEIRSPLSVPALAKRTGLPYMLVYNIVHGRVKSISDRHYRLLFKQVPPHQEPKKVDGAAFRALVELWLFLNHEATKSGLYREFFGEDHAKKPDYRIFNGQTGTVEYRLERAMLEKFAAAGLASDQLDQWLDEMETLHQDDRVPFSRIRPTLIFLQDELGVHPTSILNQSVNRYETGLLKHVSREIYDRAKRLKQKAEKVLATGRQREIERLKEYISGGKAGYTLYLDIKEELEFLRRYAKKSAKGYLGRGVWIYETGKAKRIPDWRARRILRDCDRFIREAPELRLACLPRSRRRMLIRVLIDTLLARAAQLLSEQEGIVFEKRILKPLHTQDVYKKPNQGFTRFDMASRVLGMKKKAFDLMVAKNCEIFRSVGTYSKQWYLSDLYLNELSQKEYFDLISAKYELLARKLRRPAGIDRCLI